MISDAVTMQGQVAQWTSPTLALLWKEWRQQRWIFLLLLAMPPIAFFGLLSFSQFAAYGAAPLFLCAIPIVLGANAFCVEDEDNTATFLGNLPTRSAKLFWVKAGVVFALVALAWVVLVTMFFVYRGGDLGKHGFMDMPFVVHLLIFAVLFTVAVLPATISVVARSTIGCVIGTLIALALGFFWIWPLVLRPFRGIGWFAHNSGSEEQRLAALSFIVLGLALSAGRWLWCWGRVSRRLRAKALRIAAPALVFAAVTGGPLAASYAYWTFYAPLSAFISKQPHIFNSFGPRMRLALSAFISKQPHIAGIREAGGPSADGRWVSVVGWYRGWSGVGRSAIIDTETGEWRWLSRFHESWVWRWKRMWSPDGRKLLALISDRWLWPFEAANPGALLGLGPEQGTFSYFVVDTGTGEAQDIRSLCPDLPERFPQDIMPVIGWFSEDVVALWDKQSVIFADISKGSLSRCAVPPNLTSDKIRYWRLPITDRSVFGSLDAPDSQRLKSELHILRFAPELSEAEALVLQIAGTNPALREISPDGRWCLAEAQRARNMLLGDLSYLCSVETGEAVLLRASAEMEEQGLVDSRFRVHGFRPDGMTVLLSDGDGLALFGVEDHALRTIPIPAAVVPGRTLGSVKLSPSGRYALVWIESGRDAGAERRARLSSALPEIYVTDVETGESWSVWKMPPYLGDFDWLGDERLLFRSRTALWVMNRDGTGKRRLLPEE